MAIAFSLAAAGDLHLGSSLAYLSQTQATRLGQAQLEAFYSLCKYCARHKLDYLLLTGDIFDQIDPSPALLKSFQQGLALCPESLVIVVPGNHDPYFAGGLWDQVPETSQLHIVREPGECWQSPRHPLRIYASPFLSQSADQCLFEDFIPSLDPHYFNLLLMHGDLVKSGQTSRYNPIPQTWLASSGLDLAIFGHHHQASEVISLAGQASVSYLYPGCLLGRGFDELGPKGFYAGQVIKRTSSQLDRASVQLGLKFIQVPGPCFYRADLRLDQLHLDADQDFHLQVAQALEEKVRSLSDHPDQDFFQLSLRGTRPARLDLAFLRQALSDQVFYLDLEDLSLPAADWTRYSHEPSLRAQIADLAQALLKSDRMDASSWQALFLDQDDALSHELKSLLQLPQDQQQTLLRLATDKLYAGLAEEA